MSLDLRRLPLPADLLLARHNHEHWQEAWAQWDDPALVAFARDLSTQADGRRFLDAVFGNSPFLAACLVREPAFLRELWDDGPEKTFQSLLDDLGRTPPSLDRQALMERMRIAKRRAALLIGIADIATLWPLEKITGALSTLAETTLGLACRHLLLGAHATGEIHLPSADVPDQDCGLMIFAVGKLGANELNYSSDIDLIILFDQDKIDYRGRRSPQELFVRLARDLIQMMEERTANGYVFRTDLRLRPDPGSMPIAITLEAAELYYESFGQNWERAAMIKARPVAGDLAAGAGFIKFLRPFIWRRHLDFAAIQDIHSIKRQINAHKGGGRIAVAGHNIKLGRGGIREIEFFAQTQQLIWGGREPQLRVSGTIAALRALAAAGHVDETVAESLIGAYGFLRRVEHRLQMIDDKQTQTLPEDPVKLTALATFLDFSDLEAFSTAIRATLGTVEEHYAHLFENAPPLGDHGNLVFTGGENDPETLKTLEHLGFAQADTVSAQIRGWHHGRVRATRSTRAREMLTELTPRLLEALARTNDPDTTFRRFDDFLSHLPAGVPLFALFTANPSLLDLVAEIMGDAPRLAERLAAHPNLLDSVLGASFFDPLPSCPALGEDLGNSLAEAGDYQEMLDITRRWTHEQKFRVGVQTLHNLIAPFGAGHHLADLADAVLTALQPRVEAEFSIQHGQPPGGGMAIVALGKMGSREMTATSDLDLILVYDPGQGIDASSGPKPLDPSTYYARLTQRIINAVTAKTAEGALFDIDMRLRPSGNAGPIATSLEAFARYHADMAWTWEHLALTRARIITGPAPLRRAIADIIDRTLRSRRDPDRLLIDVADMRLRMAQEHKATSPWDVKHLRGGLVDIEFVVQYLQLRWAADHATLLQKPTREALVEAGRLGLIPAGECESLEEALLLWTAIQQVLRQTVEGSFDDETAPGRLKEILVRATNSTHFQGLRAHMDHCALTVRHIYDRHIDHPAKALRDALTDKEPFS